MYYARPEVFEVYSKKARLTPAENQLFTKYFKDRGRVLDLGCGCGRTTFHLCELGHEVIGIDIEPSYIRFAKEKAEKLGYSKVSFMLGDACDLSFFDENFFDYVLFSFNGIDMIHPYLRRQRCLQEVRRVLKKSGIFAFSSHNRLAMLGGLLFYEGRSPVKFFYQVRYILSHPSRVKLLLGMQRYALSDHMMTTFISPKEQVRELRTYGWSCLDIIPHKVNGIPEIFSPWLYYVCIRNQSVG